MTLVAVLGGAVVGLAAAERGFWETAADPDLLAAVLDAADGLTVDDVTRHPERVASRAAARLATNGGLRRRFLDTLLGRWEYNAPGTHGTD